MTEEKYEIQTFKVLDFFRQHPGMVISLSYVLLTVCGIFYSWSFYNEFDVAILKLANISDLLTAGVGEPAAVLMFFGGFLVAIGTEYLSYHSHQFYLKWKSKPKSVLRFIIVNFFKSPTKNNQLLILLVVLFILYAQLFVSMYAEWQSKQIKQGVGDKIIVSSDALDNREQELLLLGSTTNFVFTYKQSEDEVSILPIENITKMLAVPDVEDKSLLEKIKAVFGSSSEPETEQKELEVKNEVNHDDTEEKTDD